MRKVQWVIKVLWGLLVQWDPLVQEVNVDVKVHLVLTVLEEWMELLDLQVRLVQLVNQAHRVFQVVLEIKEIWDRLGLKVVKVYKDREVNLDDLGNLVRMDHLDYPAKMECQARKDPQVLKVFPDRLVFPGQEVYLELLEIQELLALKVNRVYLANVVLKAIVV